MGFDLQFARPDPLDELVNASFDLGAVGRFFEFVQDIFGNCSFADAWDSRVNSLLFGSLKQFVCRAICLDADENANLLDLLKAG